MREEFDGEREYNRLKPNRDKYCSQHFENPVVEQITPVKRVLALRIHHKRTSRAGGGSFIELDGRNFRDYDLYIVLRNRE